MSTLTIAAIQVNTETGDLMMQAINGDYQKTASLMLQAMTNSKTYITKAKGAISQRKIAELLDSIQE